MEKRILDNKAYYKIWWSPLEKYDRHILSRLMPEMPGIAGLFIKEGDELFPLLFLGCWQDGIRDLVKNFMDPLSIHYKELRGEIEKKTEMEDIHIAYTVIETSPKDIQDVLHCLIQTHRPANNSQSFSNSGRYKNVYVEELQGKSFDGIGKNNPNPYL
ncbi:MAG: hypothetical protein FWG13_03300 [Leptospirales bacterium]|nr:hypothetical protein [Leptospirales bacterium]